MTQIKLVFNGKFTWTKLTSDKESSSLSMTLQVVIPIQMLVAFVPSKIDIT